MKSQALPSVLTSLLVSLCSRFLFVTASTHVPTRGTAAPGLPDLLSRPAHQMLNAPAQEGLQSLVQAAVRKRAAPPSEGSSPASALTRHRAEGWVQTLRLPTGSRLKCSEQLRPSGPKDVSCFPVFCGDCYSVFGPKLKPKSSPLLKNKIWPWLSVPFIA